ncbi:MAG TPA: stalk domain-containing protein [Abditibacteriaceae bacterium]
MRQNSSARSRALSQARSQAVVKAKVLPDNRKKVRSISTVLFASAAAYVVARAAWGQTRNPVAALPPAPQTRVLLAQNATEAIAINIDGRVIAADPPPVLQRGAVLVPLRGVLENLGAKVSYDAAEQRIDVEQGAKRASLRIGSPSAIVDLKSVGLSAAPQIIGGSTYVPLRSLAEIFGYRVSWLPAMRTVAIYSREGTVRTSTDHRAILAAAGRFGINIDFHDVSPEDVPRLLDAAKAAGAGLIRTRFDWNTLEPEKGAAFQWPIYDRVVREARTRGLAVTGVLGNSTRWASVYSRSNDEFLWRNGPPKTTEYTSWENYVRRTVGRYAGDVQSWQIWERASSNNFRSGQRVYFDLLTIGIKAARQSDPKAILLAGEPGGVNLGWTELLASLPQGRSLNGIGVYPSASWQPGRPAAPEEFVRNYAALRDRSVARGKTDLPVAGLEYPVITGTVENGVAGTTGDPDMIRRLLRVYTPQAQADYLLRAGALALASGAPQVFWNELRDEANYEVIEPINMEFGSGLLQRDFTPRLSFEAYQTLVKQMEGKRFLGAFSATPDIVALVFAGDIEANMVLWSPSGNAQIVMNSQDINPQVPNSLFIPTRADSVLLDSTGERIGGADGAVRLTNRPLWITQVTAPVMTAAKAAGKLRLQSLPEEWTEAAGTRAEFNTDIEAGLQWKKYADYRAAAVPSTEAAVPGLMTQSARDPLRPGDGKFFIFLDVDDDYLFFERGAPVEVIVKVRRPSPEVGALVKREAGFNIEYDTATGTAATTWQVVEDGEGTATYRYRLPDASFANRGGYDMVVNTFGSKRDLVFESISVRKLTP